MWVHPAMAECWKTILRHCDLDSDLVSRILVSGAYLLHYLRLESKIWVYWCILGWRSVSYHFWATVIMLAFTSDHVSRIIMPGAYLLYYMRRNPKFGVWMHLGMTKCCIPFSGHCNLYLLPSCEINRFQSIYPISFEV